MLQAIPDVAVLRSVQPGPLTSEQRLDPGGCVIGRDFRLVDILAHGSRVSRRHCRLSRDEHGNWQASDLDSTNGLFVNGMKVEGEILLQPGDILGLGQAREADFEFLFATDPRDSRSRALNGDGPWLIGRDLAHPLSLSADPAVSLNHARIQLMPEGLLIEDLGSRNGTWVDGRRVRRATLTTQSTVVIGSHELRLRDSGDGSPALIVSACQQAIGFSVEGQKLCAARRPDFSAWAACLRVLVRRIFGGWLEKPLLLIEALLLPLLLVPALWLIMPDRPANLIVVLAVTIAAALAAAFQSSRWQPVLLRLADRHLQVNELLIAMLISGIVIALIQSTLVIGLATFLPVEQPISIAIVFAAPVVALGATALGLMCGLAAHGRPILALILVCLVLAGQILGALLVD